MRVGLLIVVLAAGAVAMTGCRRDASQSRWWNGAEGSVGGAGGDYGGSYYSNLLGSWMGAPVQDLFEMWGEPHWDYTKAGVREVGYEDQEGNWGFFVDRNGIIYDGYFQEF